MAVGAKPVFVDVNEDGLMRTDLIEELINEKTKAILPVHLYGQSENVEELKSICQKNNLFLVEDACQAHGSQIQGKKTGSFGNIGCFSFYPTKNLGAFGDGGAICTDDDDLAKNCRQIRDYGQAKKYVHSTYGLNSRLDELQAALLRTKLKYLEADIERRKEIAQIYREKLAEINEVDVIGLKTWENNNFHLFVIKNKKRDELQRYLSQQKIPTLIHYPKIIPDQPIFKNKYQSIPVSQARKLIEQILSLPNHPQMSNDQVEYVCRKIREFFD